MVRNRGGAHNRLAVGFFLREFARELWRLIKADKKHGERSPRFILPVGVGKMRLVEVGEEEAASPW